MNYNFVTVDCLDSTHEGRRVFVTKFIKIEDDASDGRELSGQGWRESPGSTAKTRKAHREKMKREQPRTAREKLAMRLRADKPHAYQGRGLVGHPGFRARYDLRCELCGDTVPAREEKLFPILDRLVEADAPSISLAVLRAILPKQ